MATNFDCPSCGKAQTFTDEKAARAAFCSDCGAAFTWARLDGIRQAPPKPSQRIHTQPEPPPRTIIRVEQPSSGFGTGFGIGCGIIVAFILVPVVILIGLFLLNVIGHVMSMR